MVILFHFFLKPVTSPLHFLRIVARLSLHGYDSANFFYSAPYFAWIVACCYSIQLFFSSSDILYNVEFKKKSFSMLRHLKINVNKKKKMY